MSETVITNRVRLHRRNHFRFSLRTLLFGLLLCCLLLGWLASKHLRERRVFTELSDLGISVSYDYSPESHWYSSPTIQSLFRGTILGEGTLWGVQDVSFYPAKATWSSEHLEMLSEFPELEMLCLSETKITDAGLAHLPPLRNLRVLMLDNTDISDAALELLRQFPRLEYLYLSNTKITDEGLEHLDSLSNLHLLDLDGTRITDAGLEHLHQLKKLEGVSLSDTLVSKAGMEKLQKALPNCGIWYEPSQEVQYRK